MDLILQNLISPIVLCFLLGMVARAVRSDLQIPSAIYQAISIYLLLAIGLKGGAALSSSSIGEVTGPILITLVLGLVTPLIAFILLLLLGRISRLDAAATAAHYGSVSAVTFLAALEATRAAGIATESYIPALVAILEIPGIIVGLLLAQQNKDLGIKAALQEVLTGKSILLLLGGMVIGTLSGAEKIESVAPFFITPFKGVLCLFLLELGIVAAARLRDLKSTGVRLLLAGIITTLINGSLGCLGGILVGMSPGGAAVLGAMTGSASYIAAPAAVRIALPKASPGIYLTLSLGVTFPFNLAVGIPVFIKLSNYLSTLLT